MQPPILDDREIEVNGKVYRAKPVMLMYFYIQMAFDRGEMQPAIKMHQALQSSMHFYHSDEEILELMGELTMPEIVSFLTGPVIPQEEDDSANFTGPETEELNDDFLTSGKSNGEGQ